MKKKKISFYHWGYQCPIISEIIDLLNVYKERIDIDIIDFTGDVDFCKLNRIYFPFVTIFDDKKRWFRPLDAETLDQFVQGFELIEKPHIKKWSRNIFKGTTQFLTKDNIELVRRGCTLAGCVMSCHKKSNFLTKYGLSNYGVLHLNEERVVGGAEFLPSLVVPYDIPKGNDIAFLTCLYHSSEAHDYKTVPLKELEIYLSTSFKYLVAITDEIGSFPNGDLQLFIDNGYTDLGVISVEADYCKLHLVKKDISGS